MTRSEIVDMLLELQWYRQEYGLRPISRKALYRLLLPPSVQAKPEPSPPAASPPHAPSRVLMSRIRSNRVKD